MCAEHVRQVGGEKSPLQPDGGEVIAKRKGAVPRRGLKKRGANVRADVQEPDVRHTVPGELANDSEAHIHQRHWL